MSTAIGRGPELALGAAGPDAIVAVHLERSGPADALHPAPRPTRRQPGLLRSVGSVSHATCGRVLRPAYAGAVGVSASPPPRRPAAHEPSSDPREQAAAPADRRRVVPWLISGAVHLAVLAWWASLPEPPPPQRVAEDELGLRPIELVELPAVELEPEPLDPDPPAEPIPSEAHPTPTDEPPAPAEPREPPSSSRRPRGPTPPTGTEPTADPIDPTEPTAPPSSTGAVALLGLRDGSRAASTSGSLRPELAPPVGDRSRVSQQVGSQRPPPTVFEDGKPSTFEEAGFRTRRNGKRVFRDETGRFTATLLADGRVKFRDMPIAVSRDPLTGAPKGMAMPGLAEGLRRASGTELYQQEKKRLLEQTFELRLQLAISFAQDKLDRRLQSLYRELLDDWSDSSKSEAERRAALFRRWDECEEGLPVTLPGFSDAHSSELDDMRRSAGAQARETIERFVRRQLPAGSPQAYTSEELRTLNASRHSRTRFAPYD